MVWYVISFLNSVWATEILWPKRAMEQFHLRILPKIENYVLFDVNGPPPQIFNSKIGNFPLLNAWDDYIKQASLKHGCATEFIKAICVAEVE